jgi:hypothetical protein
VLVSLPLHTLELRTNFNEHNDYCVTDLVQHGSGTEGCDAVAGSFYDSADEVEYYRNQDDLNAAEDVGCNCVSRYISEATRQ